MKKIFLILIAYTFVISCASSDDENCSKPLNFSLNTVDENIALFNYKDESVSSFSFLEYGKPGFKVGINPIGRSQYISHAIDNGINNYKMHLLSSLQPNTNYEAYIKVQCIGETYSEYAGPIPFTTIAFGEGCTQPDSLLALEVTDTTILIDWEAYNKETWEVDIRYTVDSFEQIILYSATEKPFLIEDLSPNTIYKIKVKTNNCDGIIQESIYSTIIVVETND